MRTSTWVALVAAGVILLFAVIAVLPSLGLAMGGAALVVIGLAGLGVPQRAFARLRNRHARLMDRLIRSLDAQPPDSGDGPPTVSLDALLVAEPEPEREAEPSGPLWYLGRR